MNIKNFETKIDPTILARGKNYHDSGYVTSLEYDGEQWVADVEGSEDYTIFVTLSDTGDILDTDCDCPYDWGPYCKHQVAVFFAIKENGAEFLIQQKTKNAKTKETLDDILTKLGKPTLISLIKEFAKAYKPMKSEIEFRYAKKTDMIETARNIIRQSIAAVKHRGYVEYRDVRAAINGANIVIQMIEDKIDISEFFTAVSLAIIVMEEMMDLLSYCNDSNGYVGGAISESADKIHETILSMPMSHPDSKKIFDSIFAHASSETYDGWTEWRFGLHAALVPLCYDKELRAQLEYYLMAPNLKSRHEWHDDYETRQKQRLLVSIIAQFDDDETAQKYIHQHLDNIDFRHIAINTAIEKKQYDETIALCIEGENTNDRYPGLVKELKTLRYAAYETTANIKEQKTLALELLLDGDYDFFVKYKNLRAKNEWVTALYDVLGKTEKNDTRGIHVKILVHEKHKPRLLAYCKKIPKAITTHYAHLLPEYQQEVGAIFLDYIRHLVTTVDTRSQYREVCQLIKTYDKACPGATDTICAEIFQKHAKRTAFMDEMRKIGKH